MQYTETELNKLIETVEKEFSAVLTKAEGAQASLSKSENLDSAAPLAKAEKPEKKDGPPAEKKDAPPAKDGAKPAKEGEAAPAAAEGEQPPVAADGTAPAADGQAGLGLDQGHGYDDEDMQHLMKMYASMSKAELKVHHDAIAKVAQGMGDGMDGAAAPGAEGAAPGAAPMIGKSEVSDENPELNSKPKDNATPMNNDKANGGIKDAPPHNSPGAKSAASAANGAKINKSEFDKRNGGEISKGPGPHGSPGAKSDASKDQRNLSNMEKSEKSELELLKTEVAAKNAELETLKKNFGGVQEFLTQLVKKVPQGKAITSMEQIRKSEGSTETQPMSKSEVDQRLMKCASDPKLSKSDREAINAYYLSKSDINTISHLLKN